jgi:hypothetical protein
VAARLGAHTLLHLDEVPVCSPGVRGSAGHFAVAEMIGGGAAVLRRTVELGGRLVVEARRFVQFQTLTSR